jgi:very-short-patch-repair endonuclease
MGFNVIRFWGNQVKNDLNWCLNRVLENISDDDFEN